MAWLYTLDLTQFIVFSLVLARTSGLVITAPVFGGSSVPAQVRVLLAIALALLVTPTQLAAPLEAPHTLPEYLVVAGCETLVGLVLGLGVMIVLAGFQLAGQIVGQLSGMSLAEVYDPNFDTNLPLIGQLLNLLALAIFVLIGGHRLVIGGLLESFAQMPPGTGTLDVSFNNALVTLVAQSFELGLRAAAPATVALLLSNVVLGLLGRTLPQLNVLSFGFGFSALVTFATLFVSLGSMAGVLEEQFRTALELLHDVLLPG